MQNIIYSILLLFLLSVSDLTAQSLSFKTDNWDKEKTNIINENGDIIGYTKKDQWNSSIVNLYDMNGNIIKKMQADQWDKEKTNFYNDYGNLERSEKQDDWNKERTNIYDDEGNLIGYREPDQWDSGKINEYNNYGTKLGFYSKDEWSGELKYTETPNSSSSQLQIYRPENFQSSEVEYVPSFEVKELDLSGLEQLAEMELAQQERKIRQIEDDIRYWKNKIATAKNRNEEQEAIKGFDSWKKRTFPEKSVSERKPSKLYNPTSIDIDGKTKIVNFPKVDKYDNQNIQVTKVELKRKETIIHVRYINDGSGWVNIKETTCIYDRDKMNKLTDVNKAMKLLKQIKDSYSIPFAPYKHRFKQNFEILEFSLVFPKIDWKKTKAIDLLECESKSCFNIYGIQLDK